jgi:hypothetical protein
MRGFFTFFQVVATVPANSGARMAGFGQIVAGFATVRIERRNMRLGA